MLMQGLSEEEKSKMCQYACKKYRNLSEEEKNEKQKYVCEQYEDLPEHEKQRVVEYKKNCSEIKKNRIISQIKTNQCI